jgi:chromosome segregation ATPase
MNAAQKRKATREKRLLQLGRKAKKMGDVLLDSQTELERAQDRINQLRQENEEMHKELLEIRTENGSTLAELAASQAEVAELQACRTQAEETFGEELAVADAEISWLEDSRDDLAEKLLKIAYQLQDVLRANKETRKLNRRLAAKSKALSELQTELSQTKAKLRSLQ